MDTHTDNDGAALDNNDGVAAALSYPACLDLSLDEFKAAWKSSRRYVDRSTVQALEEAAQHCSCLALGRRGLCLRARPDALRGCVGARCRARVAAKGDAVWGGTRTWRCAGRCVSGG